MLCKSIIRVKTLLLFLLILFNSIKSFGQCPTLNQGSFISNAEGCASLDVNFKVEYGNLDPGDSTLRIYIDWGDGSPILEYRLSDTDDASINGYFLKNLIHTYPEGKGVCEYEINAYLKSQCFNENESRQVQKVIVWDSDDLMAVAPATFKVCKGNDAVIRFSDAGKWNCFSTSETMRVNDKERTLKWTYGLTSSNPIQGAEVITSSGNKKTFPFQFLY